jgi:hypothetical protein
MSPEGPHPTDALLSLVYGELSEAEAARVRAHVDGCPACAESVRGFRAVRKAAAALPREIPSDKGLESLLHYGAQAATRAKGKRNTRLTASLLATVVAAALVLVLASERRPSQTLATAPTAAPAVGPLAQADVPQVATPKPQGLPEDVATLRRVPAAAPARPSAAKSVAAKPLEADKGRAKAEEAKASGASDALAANDASAGAVARLQPSASASQGVALGQGARGVGAAGLSASRTAAAPAPSAFAVASAPASQSLKKASLDAGLVATAVDEERRRTVLQALVGASAESALPLLSELCALDSKLSHRDEAEMACRRVLTQYPGTQEALSAQRVLDALPPH